MKNYNKNNHFLQAAWVGKHFSDINLTENFSTELNPPINGRKLKVKAFLFETFLKNENEWIPFEELKREYIKENIPAESFFLSNYKISDSMDDEFAESCESFLKNIEYICYAYDAYIMLKKNAKDYSPIRLVTDPNYSYI